MKLHSTNLQSPSVDLKDAVINGLAPDGGLYMFDDIAPLGADFFANIDKMSFSEIGFEVSKTLLQGAVPDEDLRKIVEETLAFDAPLVEISQSPSIYSLELFHGPTLAFKDFGARFMARLLSYFVKGSNEEITVLVATSGDTGSAVAHGFLNVPGIKVVILYPSGKVSELQEKQLTTMGANISALEVDGTFDDCQDMVKKAFIDTDLNTALKLTSANSINIARLIPQSFYYFYTYAQLSPEQRLQKPIFSVPSGNFGNLTAGLIAKKMGLPVHKFLAATNANDTFPQYLESGDFHAKPSVPTISNAMDVGNPSNFARIAELYGNDVDALRQDVWSHSFSDLETQEVMREVYEKYSYTLDPHGAVAYLGLKKYDSSHPGILLETAHPAKFGETVKQATVIEPEIPERLAEYAQREKVSIKMNADFSKLRALLLSW